MADALSDRLDRILPGGKGVWIPMDHGASSFPVRGLEDTDSAVDAVISGGADAIVMQKGLLSHNSARNGIGPRTRSVLLRLLSRRSVERLASLLK